MIEKITYNDRKERRVSIPSTQIIEEKARKRLKDIILARNRFAIMMALTDEENRVQIKISNEGYNDQRGWELFNSNNYEKAKKTRNEVRRSDKRCDNNFLEMVLRQQSDPRNDYIYDERITHINPYTELSDGAKESNENRDIYHLENNLRHIKPETVKLLLERSLGNDEGLDTIPDFKVYMNEVLKELNNHLNGCKNYSKTNHTKNEDTGSRFLEDSNGNIILKEKPISISTNEILEKIVDPETINEIKDDIDSFNSIIDRINEQLEELLYQQYSKSKNIKLIRGHKNTYIADAIVDLLKDKVIGSLIEDGDWFDYQKMIIFGDQKTLDSISQKEKWLL